MGVSKKFTIFCVFVLSVFLVGAYAGEKQEIKKSFGVHKTVKLALVSGDCSIEAGNRKEITLSVIHTYNPEKYDVAVEKKEGVLVLKKNSKVRYPAIQCGLSLCRGTRRSFLPPRPAMPTSRA